MICEKVGDVIDALFGGEESKRMRNTDMARERRLLAIVEPEIKARLTTDCNRNAGEKPELLQTDALEISRKLSAGLPLGVRLAIDSSMNVENHFYVSWDHNGPIFLILSIVTDDEKPTPLWSAKYAWDRITPVEINRAEWFLPVMDAWLSSLEAARSRADREAAFRAEEEKMRKDLEDMAAMAALRAKIAPHVIEAQPAAPKHSTADGYVKGALLGAGAASLGAAVAMMASNVGWLLLFGASVGAVVYLARRAR